MGGPTGVQNGAAETAWTPVGAAAMNSGNKKGAVSVPGARGKDSCVCFKRAGGASELEGVEAVMVVGGGADAGISPGKERGAGSGMARAELGSEEREEDCRLGAGSAG